jgi:hypothetical protein
MILPKNWQKSQKRDRRKLLLLPKVIIIKRGGLESHYQIKLRGGIGIPTLSCDKSVNGIPTLSCGKSVIGFPTFPVVNWLLGSQPSPMVNR